jgi:hypothetical protein
MSPSPGLAEVVRAACEVRKVPICDARMLIYVENILSSGSFDLVRQDYPLPASSPSNAETRPLLPRDLTPVRLLSRIRGLNLSIPAADTSVPGGFGAQ